MIRSEGWAYLENILRLDMWWRRHLGRLSRVVFESLWTTRWRYESLETYESVCPGDDSKVSRSNRQARGQAMVVRG